MFDHWPDELTPSLRREVRPPTPVIIDLGTAIPTNGTKFRADELPLRVRAGGLELTGRVPGLLHAWARSRDGDWIALISLTVKTSNGRGSIEIQQWCSQRAIQPRETDKAT